MTITEAQKTIAVTAQRMIAACDVQKFVDYLRELGVTDTQMRSYCYDYIIVNSDLCDREAEDEDA